MSSAAEVPDRGKRQARVDETRRRIIESARELFGGDGFHRVGLEQVAEHAGVGRKTIYFQFGSKLGLLEALIGDMSRRAGVTDFVEDALTDDEPARGLRRFVSGTCALWEHDANLCRALVTLATSDVDARSIIDRVGAARLEDLVRLTRRARRLGRLDPRWTPTRAAEALWVLTSFESYDNLRRLDKPSREATDLLCAIALSLLTP
jgi:AcrR family transcriptional regulator